MRSAWLGIWLRMLLLAAGCGPDHGCEDACSKLTICGIVWVGLSCGAGCTGADLECARCVDQYSCNAIPGICGGNNIPPCAQVIWSKPGSAQP